MGVDSLWCVIMAGGAGTLGGQDAKSMVQGNKEREAQGAQKKEGDAA